MEAYSTLNPETSSDSASGKSKGARFVSAKMLTRNIRKSGTKGITKKVHDWNSTIANKLSEPVHNNTATKIKPIETS